MTTTPNPQALMQLIKRSALTYAEISKRGELPKSTVGKLAAKPLTRSPNAETLTALARGLGVPVSTVQQAVSDALGYTREPADDTTREIVNMLAEMSQDDRKMAAALVSTYYRNRGADE